jgi:branched-chain amino acid transport system substrate-binding protein
MKQRMSAFLVFALVASILVACGQTAPATAPAAEPTAAPAAPAAGSKIVVVSMLPRTGSAKGQTDTIVNAINQRLEQDNFQACGGQFTIEHQEYDDATAAAGKWDPAQVSSNINKAVQDTSVVAIIGHFNSGAAKVSIPVANQANLVMVSPANTYPGLTKPGKGEPNEPDVYYPGGSRNYARVVPADDIQGAVGARWAQSLGVKSVYVFDDAELYGKGIADIFNATAKELGLDVKGQESIDTKAADYRALAAKILDANPDLVYFGGTTQTNGGQLLKDLRAEGYAGKFMGPDGLFEKAFIEAAGNDAAEGAHITFGGVPANQLTGKGKEWYDAYKAKFGGEPEGYASYGYEAASVVMAAINKACKADRAAIRDAVMTTSGFDGILGGWSFDANGDTSLTGMSGQIIKAGEFEFQGLLK